MDKKCVTRCLAVWVVVLCSLVFNALAPYLFAQCTDIVSWGEVRRYGHGQNNEIAYGPDQATLAVATSIGVGMWDAEQGRMQGLLEGHQDAVRSVAWSNDYSKLASGSDDRTIIVWDAAEGTVERRLTGHTGAVRSTRWSPVAANLVASGSADNTARIWDVDTGSTLHTLTGHTQGVNAVSWSNDGGRIATASDDGTTRLWNAGTGAFIV